MAPPKGNKFGVRHGLCRAPEYQVCEAWSKSFLPFYEHMGPRPTPRHTLDRIDNDKGYEPGNCRWVTRDVQMRNTRRNIFIGDGDERLTVQDWARKMGVQPSMIYNRLRRGWTIQRATTVGISA